MIDELPNDENGDVLRRMLSHGDDLSRPREINFSVVFPNKKSASTAANYFRAKSAKTKVEKSDVVLELPWEMTVSVTMVPTHKAITDFELELDRVAKPLNGRNDGWGCFQQDS